MDDAPVRSEDSEVIWSYSAALHCLQKLDTRMRHSQHLHSCTHTALQHTRQVYHRQDWSLVQSKELPRWGTHWGGEKAREINLPWFPGSWYHSLLHTLILNIYVRLDVVLRYENKRIPLFSHVIIDT